MSRLKISGKKFPEPSRKCYSPGQWPPTEVSLPRWNFVVPPLAPSDSHQFLLGPPLAGSTSHVCLHHTELGWSGHRAHDVDRSQVKLQYLCLLSKKFNSSPLRICHPKRKVVFQPSLLLNFRGEESWSHTYQDPTKISVGVQSGVGMANDTSNKKLTSRKLLSVFPRQHVNLMIRTSFRYMTISQPNLSKNVHVERRRLLCYSCWITKPDMPTQKQDKNKTSTKKIRPPRKINISPSPKGPMSKGFFFVFPPSFFRGH